MKFTLSKWVCAFGEYALGCGFNYVKIGGLFSKTTREGVSDVLGRWIRIERLEMDPGEERRSWPAGTETARRLSHERRRKLAGELG